MSVVVKLTWTDSSVNPIQHRLEYAVDAGEFATQETIAVAGGHVPGVTEYMYDVPTFYLEPTTVRYRIVTIGITGAEVIGGEISVDVPGQYDIQPVNTLEATVEVT